MPIKRQSLKLMLLLHQRSFKIVNKRYTIQCSLFRGNKGPRNKCKMPCSNLFLRRENTGQGVFWAFLQLFSRFLVQNEKNNLWVPPEGQFSPVNAEIIASLAAYYQFFLDYSILVQFLPLKRVKSINAMFSNQLIPFLS